MSELKEYTADDIQELDDKRLEESESGKIDCTRVYLKSEADKVIAEKDEKIIQLEALIENYNRISREIIDNANHQKYKRCLNKAEMCEVELEKLDYKYVKDYTNKDVWRIATSYFTIWHKRWLELAEKFKPNKEVK